MKKFLKVFLTMLLLTALAGGDRTVQKAAASGMGFSLTDTYVDTTEDAYIQDFVQYCDGTMDYSKLSESGEYNVRNYSGVPSDYDTVKMYVDYLCGGNFQLIDSYYQAYDDSAFYSFGLDYTGPKQISARTEVTYLEIECTVNIYGTIERDDLEAVVWTPMDLELVDFGDRFNGNKVSVDYSGESVGAGVNKLSDGSFETTDGRFHVSLGQAQVYRDGDVYTAEAQFETNQDQIRDELWIRNFYRNESLFFCTPANVLMAGDVYTLRDVMREESFMLNKRLENEIDFTGYKWQLFFGACHDGDWITPVNSDLNEFENATIRIMYWDPGVEAVYYISAEFDSAPYAVEALAAVSLAEKPDVYRGKDGQYALAVGESMELACPDEYGASYNLYQWEVVDGMPLVQLSGEISRICTITGLAPGKAIIKLTYEYGMDEPDVLTGYPRNVSHTKELEYAVYVG